MAYKHARAGRATTCVVASAFTVGAVLSLPTAIDGALVVRDAVASVGRSTIGGTAVAASLPACTSWERAMANASADHGESLRLACIPALPV